MESYFNWDHLLRVINSRVVIKSYLNQDYLLRVLWVSNTNTKQNIVFSLLRRLFWIRDNFVHNALSLFLFNIASRPWLCTSYNYQPEVVQTDCLFVYSISFELVAFICIMAHLIVVEADNMTQVFADLTSIGDINIGIWNMKVSTLCLVLLVLLFFFPSKSLLKFYADLLWRMWPIFWLWVSSTSFWFLSPRLKSSVNPKIFHYLGLGLSYYSVY